MRILVDVNVAQRIIEGLRESKHDILDDKKINLLATDKEIKTIAEEQKRLIITSETDFSTFAKNNISIIRYKKIFTNSDINSIVTQIEQLDEEILNTNICCLSP